MRIFGSERMDSMLQRLGLQEGEAIIHPWVNKALEKAQQKVEARNFEIRKNLLRFDDVMNDQRKVVYEQRKDLMRTDDVSETVTDWRHEVIEDLVTRCIPEKAYQEQWDLDTLEKEVRRLFNVVPPVRAWANEEGVGPDEMRQHLIDGLDHRMAEKATNYGTDLWRMIEKNLLLQALDQHWKEHLFRLDHLRQGIGLRAYAQRDPLNEYKREAFDMYLAMLSGLREHVTMLLAKVEVRRDKIPERPRESFGMRESHVDAQTGRNEMQPESDEEPVARPAPKAADPAAWGKVPRNAPCPCGSGRKFKHCHGKAA